MLNLQAVSIVALFGNLRTRDILDLKTENFKDYKGKMIVEVLIPKVGSYRKFFIPEPYSQIVKKYESKRPADTVSKRFFLHYQLGECTQEVKKVKTIS